MNELIFHMAIKAAQQAFIEDEIPVAAIIFDSKTNEIISCCTNETEKHSNSLAHAEILAITKACQSLNKKRLDGYSVFVTLEPCAMCAAALSIARIDHVYFGAFDPKTGGIFQGCKTYEISKI